MGGTEIWRIISCTRLISLVHCIYDFFCFCRHSNIPREGRSDRMTMFTLLALIFVSAFFQFCTSFDQSNVYIRRKQSILQAYSIAKGLGPAQLLAERIRPPWDDDMLYIIYLWMRACVQLFTGTYLDGKAVLQLD